AKDPEQRVIRPRCPGPALDHQPDVPGVLGRQIMEAECRSEADDPVGHALARLRERVTLGDIGVSRNVDSPAGSNQQTAITELAQVRAGDAMRFQVPRAQNPGAPGQMERSLHLRRPLSSCIFVYDSLHNLSIIARFVTPGKVAWSRWTATCGSVG